MSRNKGHNLERLVAKLFREIGFSRTRTTRQASHLLDSCGIDLVGVPRIIQCKSGYMRSRPKFEEEYRYIQRRLTEEFGADHTIHNYPIAVIHELDVGRGRGKTRKPEDTYVMITLDDYLKMLASHPPESYDVLDIL